jgi:putative phosphoesterase
MKIAIISDIHDNLERFSEVAKLLRAEKLEVGICCGDITSVETLCEISKEFKQLYLVYGNADYALLDKTGLFPENVILFDGSDDSSKRTLEFFRKSVGIINIDNIKIVFAHKKVIAKERAESEKPDVVFYGHTHTPWEDKDQNTKYINPGEICGRYGKPSFAIFDTKTLTAKLVLLS